MSQVTNALLCVGVDNWNMSDNNAIPLGVQHVNNYLESQHGQFFLSIDGGNNMVGGSKNLEIEVYAAAFNHVGPNILRDIVMEAPWENPDQVQLMICDQDDFIFQVFTVSELIAMQGKD